MFTNYKGIKTKVKLMIMVSEVGHIVFLNSTFSLERHIDV